MMRRAKITTVLFVVLAGLAQADTITVCWEGGGDYTTIQEGIDAAVDGDEVVVYEGTYTGPGNRDLDFGGKAITVRSTDPNDPAVVAATVIDCNGTEEECHFGFDFHSGEGPNSVLAGLTITNGYDMLYGGIKCISSSPTISHCTITGNSSYIQAGGILCGGSPTIINCTISGNSTSFFGGGIFCAGSPTIINCTISGNSASFYGGGIYYSSGSPTITNCILWDNTAPEGPEISGNATVSYSDIEGGYLGTGNIDADPLFVNPADGNYHLSFYSPCIDGGDPCYIPPPGETDIDGEPRLMAACVDIGVDEYPRHMPNKYPTIQAAIDAADDGDTIIVGEGIYTGIGNRDLDFGGKAITVRSTDPNDPAVVAATVIDCHGTWTEHHRGFYFHSGEEPNSVLAGLTITDGFAQEGAGIYCSNSSPTIINCRITGNDANGCSIGGSGGGIYCGTNSGPKINDCKITGNYASLGGSIYCVSSSPTITNCNISGNYSSDGGGIFCTGGSPTISHCNISGNHSFGGGGIFCTGGSPTISHCIIAGNEAHTWGSGGGILCSNSSLTITNCTITDNSAESSESSGGNGGGICCSDSGSPTIINCILWGNTASDDGPEIALINDSYLAVSYSDPQGGQVVAYVEPGCTLNWGEGNIDADPCFADAANGNYHLESQAGRWDSNSESWVTDANTSPCIDAGDMSSPIGYEPFPNGGVINMGAYGGTAEASKSYFGEPVCQTPVAGDINGDCRVNFVDFSFMAFHWLEDYNP